MSPNLRALGATILFSVAGCWALLFHSIPWEFVIPNGIFYIVLTINTYFSVRFYTAFTPDEPFQTFIDLALAAAYIGLALTIGIPIAFSFFALLVFVIAPAKYAHMLGKTPYDKTLRRKILIDLVGTFTCAFVLGTSLVGLELKGAWIMAVLFTLANIYLLAIKPMYRHVQ